MKARPKRTEQQLRDAAGHVAYEVAMLCFIADRYDSIIGSPAEHEIESMALESFLVHYRNIRDFLFATNDASKKPDNVLAQDFNRDWQRKSEACDTIVPSERERINKRLAHISYSRSNYEREWDLPAMKSRLVREFATFLRKLTPDRRQYFSELSRWFPEELSSESGV